MQVTRLKSDRHGIVVTCEMVDAYRHVARGQDLLARGLRQRTPGRCIGQIRLVDERLVLLESRHMRIAEQRDAAGREQ
ncbi:hypothetical protein [Breoghania sp.]|uniref:hypothetical protein n=1 Tax=Breoghania sp. TaxID=2065378 RepID=UPI0026318410|nr:hypothetical protein [Breoghania sp.]